MSDTTQQTTAGQAQPPAALLSCRDQMIELGRGLRKSALNQNALTESLKRQQPAFVLCKDKPLGDDALDLIAATAWSVAPPVATETEKPPAGAEKKKQRAPKPRPIHDVKPSEDFFTDYQEFADFVEIPKQVHAAMAMSAVAAVANGNITIWNGDLQIPFDFWQILLTASGVGKNSILNPFREVLDAAGIDGIISGVGFGSFSQVQEHFAETAPRDLILMPEMSATLEDWRSKQFAGLVPWFTDRYDDFRIPEGKQYRKRADGDEEKETPAIKFMGPPRISILGMSAESWFFRSMQRDDVKGGFFPRFVIDWIQEPGRLIATPRKPAQSDAVRRLAAKLQQISELKGEMRLTPEAQERYEQWYIETAKRFAGFSNQAVAQPIWRRHRIHLFKFAGIYELSSSAQLEITLPALERAIERARSLESTILKIVGVQISKNGGLFQEIEDFIQEGKGEGQPKWKVFRNLQSTSVQEGLEIVRGLLLQERVYRFTRTTSGRPGEHYVHYTQREEYKRAHPKDQEIDANKQI